MEIHFKTQLLADLYEGIKVKDKEFRSNPSLIKQYVKTINKLRAANKIEQLFQINSLSYEKLRGNRLGFSSVRVNQQYRIIFQEIKTETEPFEIIVLEIEELSKHYE